MARRERLDYRTFALQSQLGATKEYTVGSYLQLLMMGLIYSRLL